MYAYKLEQSATLLYRKQRVNQLRFLCHTVPHTGTNAHNLSQNEDSLLTQLRRETTSTNIQVQCRWRHKGWKNSNATWDKSLPHFFSLQSLALFSSSPSFWHPFPSHLDPHLRRSLSRAVAHLENNFFSSPAAMRLEIRCLWHIPNVNFVTHSDLECPAINFSKIARPSVLYARRNCVKHPGSSRSWKKATRPLSGEIQRVGHRLSELQITDGKSLFRLKFQALEGGLSFVKFTQNCGFHVFNESCIKQRIMRFRSKRWWMTGCLFAAEESFCWKDMWISINSLFIWSVDKALADWRLIVDLFSERVKKTCVSWTISVKFHEKLSSISCWSTEDWHFK